MKITLVKKILANGKPCAKCRDVIARLEASGQMQRIDEVLVADERLPDSPGQQLANRLQVDRAPFFVVNDQGVETVYRVYFTFARDVLGIAATPSRQAQDILSAHPDLDYL